MFVVGARGDGELWVFRASGAEAIEAGGKTVQALRFMRQARKTYDTQVDVWLDPALHHLPIKARLSNAEGSDAFELLLRRVDTH